MIKFVFENIKTCMRYEKVAIPQSCVVAPYVYAILIAVGLYSFGTTAFVFMKTDPKKLASQLVPTKKFTKNASAKKMPEEFNAIVKRNIFNLDGMVPDIADDESGVCSQTPGKSSLAYTVVGIVFGGDSVSSTVLLERKSDNTSQIYKLGDAVIANIVVSDIEKDRVYLKGAGCPEYLAVDPPPQIQNRRVAGKKTNTAYSENGFERVGNDSTVTRQWVNDILNNKLSSVLEEARAIPYLEDGQVKGFTVTQIAPNSVYSKLGLQNGDVISSINGVVLNDAARAIQTLNSLRDERNIQIGVMRSNQPLNLKVNIQ